MAADRPPTRAENHMSEAIAYREPDPSRACRNVIRRSKASLRGSLVAMLPAFERARIIHFESMLEFRFLCLALTNKDIWDIREQPSPIQYCRSDGRVVNHAFDFLLVFKSGERIAVAIKPSMRARKSGFATELRYIAAAVSKSFAHRVVLVTEEHIDKKAAEAAYRQIMHTRSPITEARS